MPSASVIERDVDAALAEDIGSGDVTAQLIGADVHASARVFSRQAAVLCGTAWFDGCFRRLDPAISIHWEASDGASLDAGALLCTISGKARALLTAERTALNFLQTLSGTATLARIYAEAVSGTGATIMDSRKTLPGLRAAQKYAVRVGGGANQRMGLYDGILIKENHIEAAGGVLQALAAAQALVAGVPIQIEVENLDQLDAALAGGAMLVLLDNFDLETLRQAVAINRGRAVLEASGNITLENIRAVAETGVQRISVGSLTKNVQAVDLSMRLDA